jgi:hypothetical protein
MRRNAGGLTWKFRTDLDADGRPEPAAAPGYFEGPELALLPAEAAYVSLALPADVAVGERFTLQLVAHDRFANLAAPGRLRVMLRGDAVEGLSEPVELAGAATRALEGLRAVRPGLFRIDGTAEPPLPVHGHYAAAHAQAPPLRRFFGDLQFHTGSITGHAWDSFIGGDHRGQYTRAREAYEYARVAARLDFAALTEHDLGATAEGWRAVQALTEELDRREDFSAFRAYEWTPKDWSTRGLAAHQVVLYRGDAGEIVAWDPAGGPANPYADLVERLETQREALARSGRDGAFLLIPHPMGTQAEVEDGRHPIFAPEAFDSRVAPVSEFHSRHVSRKDAPHDPEMFVKGPDETHSLQYAWGLRRLRVGVIGSSDNHVQMPGVAARAALTRHAGSLAVLLAPANTRADLWEALTARHSYGTTGTRIYLDFTADGHVMGESFRARGPRRLSIRVGASGPLAEVSVVRFRPESGFETILAVREFPHGDRYENADFVDADPLASGEALYYLRAAERELTLPDGRRVPGGFALSSPIWIDPPDPEPGDGR